MSARLSAMLAVPEIRNFIAECAAVKDDGHRDGFCPNAYWYGRWERSVRRPGLKDKLKRLVGWGTLYGFTGESDYSELYDHAYAKLPDCREGPRCGCFRL